MTSYFLSQLKQNLSQEFFFFSKNIDSFNCYSNVLQPIKILTRRERVAILVKHFFY
jgi:hypothetical protein